MKTSLCMVLDESEAMVGSAESIVDGYNEFIEEQQKIKDETSFYFFKFNDVVTMIHNNDSLGNIPKLEVKDYAASGQCVLHDAITCGINALGSKVDINERFLFVIISVGESNFTQSETEEKMNELISKCHERGNWTFVYIGKSSTKFAEKTKIPTENVIDFQLDNIKGNFKAASFACTKFRSSNEMQSQTLLSNFTEEENRNEECNSEERNDAKKFIKEVIEMFRPEGPIDALLLTVLVYLIHNYYYYFFDVMIMALLYYLSRFGQEDV